MLSLVQKVAEVVVTTVLVLLAVETLLHLYKLVVCFINFRGGTMIENTEAVKTANQSESKVAASATENPETVHKSDNSFHLSEVSSYEGRLEMIRKLKKRGVVVIGR